jgi:hypothetical protein
MGIEPTGETVNATPNGFEDRGRHQACKHFRIGIKASCGKLPEGLTTRSTPSLFVS